MLVWLALLFYDFCGFRSVAVNSVYKLQFFLHLLRLESKHIFDHVGPLLPPGLPSRTFACTVSSELIGLCF